MANRFFNQFKGSLQKGVVFLYAKFTVSGGVATVVTSETLLAPANPTSHNPSNGFVGGVVSSGVTGYTFALQDPYVGLLDVHVTPIGAPTSGQNVLVSSIVFVDNVTSQTAPSFNLAFLSSEVIPAGGPPPTASGLTSLGAPPDGTYLLSVALYNSTAL
jgi:hypothetical protein